MGPRYGEMAEKSRRKGRTDLTIRSAQRKANNVTVE